MDTTPTTSNKSRRAGGSGRATATLRISDQTIGGLVEVFKMLADESRLRIMLALAQAGELHVTAPCALLRHPQPAVSHHLTLLREQSLVGFRRVGKHNYYRVASGLVRELLEQFFADAGAGLNQLRFEDFSLVYKRK